MNKRKNQKGFTLLELVMYVGGLLILGSVIIVLIIQFFNMYRELISIPKADRTALLVVDRITKEVRGGSQIDSLNSLFGTPNGVLEFDTVENGITLEKRFYVENGRIKYKEGNLAPVDITPSGLTVSNLTFTFVPIGVSQGVRMAMELQFETRKGIETKSYTGFAILRESYE